MPSDVAKAKDVAGTSRTPKIPVKKAVAVAMATFLDLFPAAAKANVMLEELEESGDGRRWLVTLGYDTAARRTLMDLGGGVDRRYKTFAIDNITGKLVSVKIRSVA